MTRWWSAISLVVCTAPSLDPPVGDLANLKLPPPPPVVLDARWFPPPPPPPPPPLPGPIPPPDEVAAFLRAPAGDEPLRVTRFELGALARPRDRQLLGLKILRQRPARAPAVDELVRRLGLDTSYESGMCGCSTNNAIGLRLTRGAHVLELRYDLGNVYLTPRGVDGPHTRFSDAMIEVIEGL